MSCSSDCMGNVRLVLPAEDFRRAAAGHFSDEDKPAIHGSTFRWMTSSMFFLPCSVFTSHIKSIAVAIVVAVIIRGLCNTFDLYV